MQKTGPSQRKAIHNDTSEILKLKIFRPNDEYQLLIYLGRDIPFRVTIDGRPPSVKLFGSPFTEVAVPQYS